MKKDIQDQVDKSKEDYLKSICKQCPSSRDDYKDCKILTCECSYTIASKAWDTALHTLYEIVKKKKGD